MNRGILDKITRAVLYEGYILYPYRPSIKSRQRWTFGGIYPQAWSDAQEGADAWTMQTQCLVTGGDRQTGDAKLTVIIRFLHLIDRIVGKLAEPIDRLPDSGEPRYQAVQELEAAGRRYQPWQEATEREIEIGAWRLDELLDRRVETAFRFPAHRRIEPIPDAQGSIVGILLREQQEIEGCVEISAIRAADNLHRVTVRILNRTALADAPSRSRDESLMRSLISTHTILAVENGEFVSLIDPPGEFRAAADQCRNVGAWPILVGEEPVRDTMLSSPITLYDYPQIASESPGDLFDATEIDEILSLRILTLTDDEKRSVADVDSRAGDLLRRTESLAREQLMQLHGTVRGMRPVAEQANTLEHSNG